MLEKNYLKLSKKDKDHKKILGIAVISFSVCFVSFLFASIYLFIFSLNNFIVIDKTSNHIPYEILTKKEVMKKHIKQHCIFTSYYLNSFDRATLKSNQAKSLFFIDKNSAYRVFDTYITNKSYAEALNNGYAFKNEFIEIQELNISEKPYSVTFLSKTVINNGYQNISEINILTKGIISTITPTDDNLVGWYFSDLEQQYKRINYDENN